MLAALRRSFLSKTEWQASQLLRGFSAEAAAAQLADASDAPVIHVACVLERLPIVAGTPPAWEADYHDWVLQHQIKQGTRSDYPEVKHIYAPMSDARSKEQSKAQRPSTAPTQEAGPAVPLTPADAAKDLRSMRRALSERLYLLVRQPLPNSSAEWHFPHAQLQEGESIRDTCERALFSAIGQKYPTYFIGNAPMAHVSLSPSGSQLFFMLAQAVDDPWGPLTLPPGSPASAYAWVTRQEAMGLMADTRTAEQSNLRQSEGSDTGSTRAVSMAQLLPLMLP